MKFEVDLISKELIKPSSPTPHLLRRLQFSFLDQILVPVSMPFVLFYPNETNTSNSERCNLLKKSLSKALTIFYPLAGRVKNNIYVDCSDEGVLFVEAQAKLKLLDILQHSDPSINNNLIPLQPDDSKGFAAFFQVTFFTCGGLAISFAMSHKLGDALSQFIFLNSWAAIARGDSDISIPPFGTSTFFPPTNISGFDPRAMISKDNISTKRFVFNLSIIAALKTKYSDDNNGIRLSSVVALSAFIWSRFMAATQANRADNSLYMVSQTLNLRPRIEPPLSELQFGNICTTIPVMADMEAKDDDCYGIVSRIRDAITSVNVKLLQKSDEYLDFVKEKTMKFVKDEVIGMNFTSLCKFPVYEADFGWGKPECVGSARVPSKNLVIFMDTKGGDGIEAWISLKEEEMAKFEVDMELLLHVCSTTNENPSMFQTLKMGTHSKL